MPAQTQSKPTATREVTLTRTFDAPVDLVYKAWTDPKQLAKWWGPHHFTNPVCKLDLRVGGKIHILMKGPHSEHPMSGEFKEIVPNKKLVFTAFPDDEQGHHLAECLNSVTFTAVGDKTKVTVHATATTSSAIGPQMLAGMEEGWSQSLDKLLDQVTDSADREMSATREYDAPRELVYQVWTDPKHVVHWYGPDDFSLTIHKMEVKPGGVWEFVMHGPDGTDYKNKIVYSELLPHHRIAYDHVSGPFFHAIVTLEAAGPNLDKTRLTMRGIFESVAARTKVVKEFNALEGQKQHLHRLGEYLAKVR